MTTPTPYGSGETSAAKVLRLFPALTLDAQEEEHSREAVPTPRFQLFSAIIHLDKYENRKPFYLFGDIKAYSPYNVQASCEDVWLPPDEDDLDFLSVPAAKPLDYDVSTLFCADSDQPVRMLNSYTLLALTNTSIPLYSSIYIVVDLYAKKWDDDHDDDDDDEEEEFFQVSNNPQDFNLPVQKYDTFCKDRIKIHDGSLNLIHILVTDPVDASLDITFKAHPDYNVSGILFSVKLHAYYGDNYGNNGKIYKNGFNYLLPLFVADLVTLSDNYKITLNTSSLAVPAKGKLMIWAMIYDMYEGVPYVEKRSTFVPKHKGSTNGCIQGSRCSLEVNVNWKYKAATVDSDDLPVEEAEHQQLQQHMSGEGGDEPEEGGIVSGDVKETGDGPIY